MSIRSRLGRLRVALRRRWVERHLTRHLPRSSCGITEVCIAGEPGTEMLHHITLRQEGRRLVLAFDYRRLLRTDHLFLSYRARPGVLLDAFCRARPDVTEVRAEISDGAESADGIVSFCSRLPGAILVPDPYFYSSRGYESFRAPGPLWSERDPTVVWRGVSTGRGAITNDEMTAGDGRLIQRTRLCIDGNTNAWSNLFTRLLLGCCVIKVASLLDYRQWYYGGLRPFKHFVPVAADLSDLMERIEWCRSHETECAAIAAAGRAFALEHTFEREMATAADRLRRQVLPPL